MVMEISTSVFGKHKMAMEISMAIFFLQTQNGHGNFQGHFFLQTQNGHGNFHVSFWQAQNGHGNFQGHFFYKHKMAMEISKANVYNVVAGEGRVKMTMAISVCSLRS